MSELATTQSLLATRSVRLPPFTPLLPGAGAVPSRLPAGSRRSSRLLFVPAVAVRAARAAAEAVAQPPVEVALSEEANETPIASEHAAPELLEGELPHDDYSADQPTARLPWTPPVLEVIEASVPQPTPAPDAPVESAVQPEAEVPAELRADVQADVQPERQAEEDAEMHSVGQAEPFPGAGSTVEASAAFAPADELSDALAWPEASTAATTELTDPPMAAPDQALAGIAEELHDSAAPWAQPAEAAHDNDAWSRTALAEMFPDPRATVAASLERIAQRIRDGDVSISRDASTSSDASALAAVLAALLRETARQ